MIAEQVGVPASEVEAKPNGRRRAGRTCMAWTDGPPVGRPASCRTWPIRGEKAVSAAWHPLADGMPPDWAAGWGQDGFGVFVSFDIAGEDGEVATRLRWIPPGRFLMGSPASEAGRWDYEGPQHEVTLTAGFWLAETPCTQALWLAVTGENPSRFVDPERPVEHVSWDLSQEFLERLNDLVPGLSAGLPSEAQWEYACRAGTTTATPAGDLTLLGENNAPELETIAWYGGNSGVGYDLTEGEDSTDWSERAHQHERAGTRRVATKVSNAWGLFDMLGNVDEWCADGLREYADEPVTDPLGPQDERASRGLRGGSWFDLAKDVRSASRRLDNPGARYGDVGFRLARVQRS